MNFERLEDRRMLTCELGKDFSVVSSLVDSDAAIYESQVGSGYVLIKRTFSIECNEYRPKFIIDWGDGSTDEHYSTSDTAAGSNPLAYLSHGYKQPGTYHLTVSEVRTGFVLESTDVLIEDFILDRTHPYRSSLQLENGLTVELSGIIAGLQNLDVYDVPTILGHNFELLVGKYGYLEFTPAWTRPPDPWSSRPFVADIPYGLQYTYTSPELMDFANRLDTFVAKFVDDEGNSSAVEFEIRISPRRTPVIPPIILGDIDGDRQVTERDRDQFFKEAFADADMDGDIDADDVTLMRELFGIPVGDANLDGVFDSGDLVLLFQHGKYETGKPAHWNRGDFNGDGLFDTSDLVAAFVDGRYDG